MWTTRHFSYWHLNRNLPHSFYLEWYFCYLIVNGENNSWWVVHPLSHYALIVCRVMVNKLISSFLCSCKSCGQSAFHCPGHCGHIELVLPAYNPLLFNILHSLLERTCINCCHFRMRREEVILIWSVEILIPLQKSFFISLNQLNVSFKSRFTNVYLNWSSFGKECWLGKKK